MCNVHEEEASDIFSLRNISILIVSKEATMKIFGGWFSNALHVTPKPIIYVCGGKKGTLSLMTFFCKKTH
jgi:hypothetical protein